MDKARMVKAAEYLAAVVIGRNEGKRLRTCLQSVLKQSSQVIYVDSGSTDASVELALSLGAEVVNLSTDRPFTAARARNVGFNRLLEIHSDVKLVQFVDGDCELRDGWLDKAGSFMATNADVAIVCGRRRERYPTASKYNQLCDIEWDTPVGPTTSCGGDFLVRVNAFRQVGGFTDALIAGEEPDLCFRLRQAGWRIYRLDAEMTLHDAAMVKFSQWWQRSVRSGYATAEAYNRRGQYEPDLKRQILSNILWGLPISLPAWPVLWLRVYRRSGALYAWHICVGKLPHLVGQISYWWHHWRGQASELIEYK